MFQCKDLLALPSMAKAKVISGHSGLANSIRWVYKPENMHFSRWVKGRELMIISTPVIQSKDFNLLTIVKEAVKLKMSGALLLIGSSYVNKISKEVFIYTDKNKFPLFVISGDTPLIDVFEEIGHAIAYCDNADADSEDVLSNVIFGSEINVDALRLKSEMLGYDLTPPQQIFIMHLYSSGYIELHDRDAFSTKMKECFEKRKIVIVLSRYGDNFVGMFHASKHIKEKLSEIYQEMKSFIQTEYQGWEICFGIGKEYERLEKLQHSFKEASRCIILAERMNQHKGVFFYKDLGFLNLLFELDDTKLVNEFINGTIGEIIVYDKEKNTELLQTLKVYLNNDCSLLHASEQLHTHRNTVKYRIRRVEEITDKSLADSMTRLEFMNAILCWEICKV